MGADGKTRVQGEEREQRREQRTDPNPTELSADNTTRMETRWCSVLPVGRPGHRWNLPRAKGYHEAQGDNMGKNERATGKRAVLVASINE